MRSALSPPRRGPVVEHRAGQDDETDSETDEHGDARAREVDQLEAAEGERRRERHADGSIGELQGEIAADQHAGNRAEQEPACG